MDRSEKEEGCGNPWFQSLCRKREFRNLFEKMYEMEFQLLMVWLQTNGMDVYYRYTWNLHRCDGVLGNYE